MTLAMTWDEWSAHDAVALADRVRAHNVTPAELAAQAAAAIAKTNPALSAVVEVFDDAVADPHANGTNLNGLFAGVPYLMKDSARPSKAACRKWDRCSCAAIAPPPTAT